MNKTEERELIEEEYDAQLEEGFVKMPNVQRKKLTPKQLKEKIVSFLSNHTICTLATCTDNVPRATPVRYKNRDLTIYILTEGGGKVRNIARNPLVSIALYGDYTGFPSVKGLQLWGRAEIIYPEDKKRYREAWEFINVEGREDLKKMGITRVKPDMKIIKIEAERARYLNLSEGILNQVLSVTSG